VNAETGHARQYFRLADVPEVFPSATAGLRILLLADDGHRANVVQDHIQGFLKHSIHRYTVLNPRDRRTPEGVDENDWDAILIHYSIYSIEDSHRSKTWQAFIAGFRGVVAAIHEDEYQLINRFRQRFAELGVQALFSCLDSPENLERVYGGDPRLAETLFFSCLPGYIPRALQEAAATPVLGRPLDVAYRGRTLQPQLGRLGQEKRLIGERFEVIAREHGLRCDVSSAEDARIYGAQWPAFLASGKAMLGVEGGATIFAFDGTLQADVARYQAAHPDASFEDIWRELLAPHEGNIDFRTLTPKFFEAIAAGTVLVLYPGRYSGILEAHRHYIPLERDGSNAAEVVSRLRDDAFLQAMADRARSEVLYRDDLTTEFYVRQIDRVLGKLFGDRAGSRRLRSSMALRSLLDGRNLTHELALGETELRRRVARTEEELVGLREAIRASDAGLDELRGRLEEERRARIEAEQASVRAEARVQAQEARVQAQEARVQAQEVRVQYVESRLTSGRVLLSLLVRTVIARLREKLGGRS